MLVELHIVPSVITQKECTSCDKLDANYM